MGIVHYKTEHLDENNYSEENWERLLKGLPVRIPKILRPKRLTSRNTIEIFGRRIYVARKNENMKEIRVYSFFDTETGIKLFAHRKKEEGERLLRKAMERQLERVLYLEECTDE